MHVHHNRRGFLFERLDLRPSDSKRTVERGHRDPSHQLHDADLVAGHGGHHHTATPRHAFGIVRRTQKPRFVLDVVDDLFFVPDVIAGRNDVEASLE